jgi:hypothetical protein
MFSLPETVFAVKCGRRSGLLIVVILGFYPILLAQEVQIWMDGYAFNQIDRSLELESNIV